MRITPKDNTIRYNWVNIGIIDSVTIHTFACVFVHFSVHAYMCMYVQMDIKSLNISWSATGTQVCNRQNFFSILHEIVCHCVLKEGQRNFINIKTRSSHLVQLCILHICWTYTEDISKLISLVHLGLLYILGVDVMLFRVSRCPNSRCKRNDWNTCHDKCTRVAYSFAQ